MTFQQLQNVLEIYHAGSISLAAKNMFVSQSSLSVSLYNLEKSLGFPIFVRTSQGVIPTEQGIRVIEHAGRICENYDALANMQARPAKKIRYSFPDYDPLNRAFILLLEENKHRQDLSFSQSLNSSKSILEKLFLFELDLGFLTIINNDYFHILEADMIQKGLQWEIIETFPLVITIGPGHRLYHKATVLPVDLENDILMDTVHRTVFDDCFFKKVFHLSEDRLFTTSRSRIRFEAISRGLVYSIGRTPSESYIRQYQLRCIPIEGLESSLLCIRNPLRPLQPESEHFLQLVKDEIATEKH